MNPSENNIESLRARMAGRETNVSAVVKAAVDAAENLNEALNAFLQIDREGALARAAEIDGAADESSLMAGIPLAIKDNICVRGLQASCGSRILGAYHP